MKSTIRVPVIAISLALLLLTSMASAISLQNRTGLEFQLGMRGADDYKDEVAYNGISTRYGTDNLMFSMGVKHWVDENMAMTFSIALLAGENTGTVGIPGVINEDFAVVSVLLGARYYFPRSNRNSPVFPYLAFGAGPVIGNTTYNVVNSLVYSESRTATAYGAYFGGGFDLAFGRRVLMGLNVGYYAMTDFAREVGYKKNYSDPTFGVSFSFMFGGGR